jgi:glycosyltransferase involved in cell wall biosynthesis
MDGFDVVQVGPFPESADLIFGGVQASVYGLSLALKELPEVRRIKVFALPVANARARADKVVQGLPVTYLDAPLGPLSSSVVRLPSVIRTIASMNDPIVHVHGTGTFQAALCSIVGRMNLRLVWTLHGITEKETRDRWRETPTFANWARYQMYRRLERFLLRATPQVIVDTDYVKNEVEAVCPAWISHKIRVIPQGIFSDEFASANDGARDDALILCIGAIHPRKGQHLLVQSFVEVKQAVPKARLILAGALSSAEYRDSILSQIDRLGLGESVSLRQNQPRQALLELLGQATVFALHSQEESQGIALCEALAAGVPVVATRVGGIPFVVTHNEDGILCDYGDVQAFASSLAQLLTDHRLWSRLSLTAKASSARFGWDAIARQVASLYNSIPHKSGGRTL